MPTRTLHRLGMRVAHKGNLRVARQGKASAGSNVMVMDGIIDVSGVVALGV